MVSETNVCRARHDLFGVGRHRRWLGVIVSPQVIRFSGTKRVETRWKKMTVKYGCGRLAWTAFGR